MPETERRRKSDVLYDASTIDGWKHAKRTEALMKRMIGLCVTLPFALWDIGPVFSTVPEDWVFHIGVVAAISWPFFVFFVLEQDLKKTFSHPVLVTKRGVGFGGDFWEFGEIASIIIQEKKVVLRLSAHPDRGYISISKRLIPNFSAFASALPVDLAIEAGNRRRWRTILS